MISKKMRNCARELSSPVHSAIWHEWKSDRDRDRKSRDVTFFFVFSIPLLYERIHFEPHFEFSESSLKSKPIYRRQYQPERFNCCYWCYSPCHGYWHYIAASNVYNRHFKSITKRTNRVHGYRFFLLWLLLLPQWDRSVCDIQLRSNCHCCQNIKNGAFVRFFLFHSDWFFANKCFF